MAFLRTMYLGTWGADMLQHRSHVEHATVQRGCGEIHTCASERMSIITGTCARPLRGRNHGFPFLNAPAEFYIEHWFQRKRCALGTYNCPGNTLVSRLVSLLCFPSTSPHIAFHSPHAAFSVNQLLGGQEKGVEDCAVCILDKVFKNLFFFKQSELLLRSIPQFGFRLRFLNLSYVWKTNKRYEPSYCFFND